VIVRFGKSFAGARFGYTRFVSLGTFAASDLAPASATAAAATKVAPSARPGARNLPRSFRRFHLIRHSVLGRLPFLMDRGATGF
jgi:hypothetical protein